MAVRTEDLWLQYAATRDSALRDKLILQYTPLVKYVVGRLAINLPTVVDSDDVISYGILGLLDAVDRFDPSRGIKFETYAITRIRGSIIDSLRSLDQIPRTTRQRAREIEVAYVELEVSLGQPPTDTQVAAHLGVDVARFHQLLLRTTANTVSLDASRAVDYDSGPVSHGDLIEDQDSPDPVGLTERNEVKTQLIQSINRLPERERIVLALYYNEELTMKEISRVMEISESRVCQLNAQALVRLRGYMRSAVA